MFLSVANILSPLTLASNQECLLRLSFHLSCCLPTGLLLPEIVCSVLCFVSSYHPFGLYYHHIVIFWNKYNLLYPVPLTIRRALHCVLASILSHFNRLVQRVLLVVSCQISLASVIVQASQLWFNSGRVKFLYILNLSSKCASRHF